MTDHPKFDLDNSTLDDIEDLPSFLTFPDGAYLCLLHEGFEEKEINEKQAVSIPMTLKQIMECSAPDEEKPKEGDICNTAYMLDNETGRGFLKERLKEISSGLNLPKSATTREIMKAAKGVTVLAILKRTTDKVDKDKHYQKIVKLAVT
jgi:hypothetical protein